MPGRHLSYPSPEPEVARASLRTWPYADELRTLPVVDPVTATERLYWRHNGCLAYTAGQQYPASDRAALVAESEHFAALRGETPAAAPVAATVAEAAVAEPAVFDLEPDGEDEEPQRRKPGRPALPRDSAGNIIR